MKCPNCGRELAYGEACVCGTYQAPVNSTPANEQDNSYYNQQAQQFQQAQPEQQPGPQYNAPDYAQAQQQSQYYIPNLEEPARTDYPEGYKIKKKYIAVILGALFGAFGAHNFYLGNTSKAIVQILLATVGILIAVGPAISIIWGIVETIMLLTENINKDSNGYKILTIEESIARELNK